jgi:UDP-glucose 4-epimerase
VLVLVTGASGFIGRRLLLPGDRALLRKPIGMTNEVLGNLLDPASLVAACADVDTIFHCAGYAHGFASSDTDIHWQTNYDGTCNLLKAAGGAGVQRFVFLSSVKSMAEPGDECVDENWPGEPATPYGKAKRAAEEAVLEAGAKFRMHVVNLRLAMVYGRGCRGNLERMAKGIKAGWFPPLPETGNRRSLLHVNDAIAAIRCVAGNSNANGKTYIVAEQRAYSTRQIYDAIRRTLSKSSLRWHVPAELLRASGIIGDAFESLIKVSTPINSEMVSRLLDSACYLPARIERELGWQASVTLLDGLKEMLRDETIS